METKMMIPSRVLPAREPMLEVMMTLARCSKQRRIIIAGAKSAELMAELHSRGYHRAASTATCGLPHGQYDSALIDWRQRSTKALATTLDWLVDFLTPTGVLAIWVDPQDAAGNSTFRTALESHGLTVEAGSIHVHGSAISARRCEISPFSKVA
jgi:hypothetical protein